MMKSRNLLTIFLFASLIFTSQFSTAQLPRETEAQKAQRLQWWTNARFGMFIHWGLYALPARHEWVKNRERTNQRAVSEIF